MVPSIKKKVRFLKDVGDIKKGTVGTIKEKELKPYLEDKAVQVLSEDFVKKTYECPYCQSKIAVEVEALDTITCACGTKGKDFKLLATEYTDEQWENELKNIKTFYPRIQEILRTYMDLTEDAYHLVTLWIIGTYVYDEFQTFPLLFINAVKGSGKTRLLKLIESLAWNGKIHASLSEAVLFRIKKTCTLLLDEFEQVGNKESSTLRELLNASYKKGIKVERMKKISKGKDESYEAESFDLYSPVAMANIWGMDDTLGDRCINVVCDKTNDPRVGRLVEDFHANSSILRLKEAIQKSQCSLCNVVSKKNIYTTWNVFVNSKYTNYNNTYNTYYTYTTHNPSKQHIDDYEKNLEDNKEFFNRIFVLDITGRDLEILFPLIIISKVLGDDVLNKTLDYATRLVNERKLDDYVENLDVLVMDFLWRNYYNRTGFISVTEMYDKLKGEIQEGVLSIKGFGRMLKRLNVVAGKKRLTGGIQIMLNLRKLKEKLGRYKTVIDKDD